MTPEDVRRLVDREINAYRPPLGTAPTLGQRWSLDKELGEIQLLRESLVLPAERPVRGDQLAARRVWLVALHEGYAVFLDEKRGCFGLGWLDEQGQIDDWHVYGGVASCFMAR